MYNFKKYERKYKLKTWVKCLLALQSIFLILKLTGSIAWPWLGVLSPVLTVLAVPCAYIGLNILLIPVVIVLAIIKEKKQQGENIPPSVCKGKDKEKIVEKNWNESTIQSMVIDGASKEDIQTMIKSKEYKEYQCFSKNQELEKQEKNLNDFMDYINMNITLTSSQKKKLLLKVKKAYFGNSSTLSPINYVENISKTSNSYQRTKHL